ncbi:UDP-N-acetylglucosamine 2-epimerase, partial [Hungatella sp. SL.1.14]|uniref:UDP-N-acetylglucosamine 2-epimerase n=1 Tax=Hungatella sp. SL.1.14 TaxID=2963703 RepID=UPI00210860BA
TNGAPGGSTEVVMTYIFKYFFSYGESAAMGVQFGYASSMAVVTAVILGIVTLIYLKVSKNRTYNIYSPYPEEFNRQATGIVSQFNFAPTEKSRQNLLKEGKV